MTSELSRLQASLRETLGRAFEMPEVPRELLRQSDALVSWLGGAGGGRPTRDSMREAVAAFRKSGQLASLGEARLTCFGAVERFAQAQSPLIEDGQAFPRLLEEVDQYLQEPRSYRRCYRGLLHSYFGYDPDVPTIPIVGRRNWEQLRAYLNERIQCIGVDGTQPEWVSGIQSHRNLVTTDPVTRYGLAALRGDSSAFDDARVRLEIDRNAWVMRRLILAQVKAAVAETDGRFYGYVEALVALLLKFPLQLDEGLALVLDRYAAGSHRGEHAALRDGSIEAWGNPSLVMNDAKWSRVQPATRHMVRNWLNLDLIRQFFSVLAEDRSTDQRRVKFWEKYHTQVQDIYFALGPNALRSRSPDIKRLREKMGSHMLSLTRGGGTNNAFIMRMGDYLVVEFGVSGNACRIFRGENLPFTLSGEVAADSTELRHDSRLHRLPHVDRSSDKWEEEFRRTLATMGIRPGPAVASPQEQPQRPTRLTAAEAFSWPVFRRFVDAHGLHIEDLTNRGGRLWLIGAPEQGPLTSKLAGWGFRWVGHREAWYRAE